MRHNKGTYAHVKIPTIHFNYFIQNFARVFSFNSIFLFNLVLHFQFDVFEDGISWILCGFEFFQHFVFLSLFKQFFFIFFDVSNHMSSYFLVSSALKNSCICDIIRINQKGLKKCKHIIKIVSNVFGF